MTTAMPYPVENCATCNAPIIRAINQKTLKPSVIDAEPSAEGNVQLAAAEHAVLYRVLSTADRFGRTDLRTSHFATCPDAASWRRTKQKADR